MGKYAQSYPLYLISSFMVNLEDTPHLFCSLVVGNLQKFIKIGSDGDNSFCFQTVLHIISVINIVLFLVCLFNEPLFNKLYVIILV